MGTTLTGTTPQDTYDSLIKVTDNGPLTGSLKTLTDGLGNDSALALSTGAASITGTLAVSGNATFDTNTLFVDAANNRVGVGTTSPNTALDVNGTINVRTNGFQFGRITTNNVAAVDGGLTFQYITGDVFTNGIVLNSAGNVGIGTSSPSGKLHVSSTGDTYFVLTGGSTPLSYSFLVDANDMRLFTGVGDSEKLRVTSSYLRLASGMGGIQFNGDTAAANALDDYEEGTWTPVLDGTTTSPTVTYAAGNTGGIYTKVGNKVSISFEVRYTDIVGGSGSVIITGLPFTRKNTNLPDGDHVVIETFAATISGKYLKGAIGSNNSGIGVSNVNSAAASSDLLISDLLIAGLGFIRGSATYFV